MNRLFVIAIVCLFAQSAFADQWIKRADFGGVGRHRGIAISIGTKGYMGLGHYNGAGPNIVKADWWEYDPATNAWTQKADYIGNGSIGNYAVLAFGMDNYGYIGGGQVASNNSFWRYNPSTNAWTSVAPMPTIAMNTYGFAIGRKGYYLSGNIVYEYDSDIDQWTQKNNAPFNVGIWNSTFVIDGKGYVKFSNKLYEYKPTTDQWIQRSNLPSNSIASAGSSGFSQNGKGYIVTGYGGFLANVTKQVWEYDPGANTWDSLPNFPGSARRFSASFQIGERCFFGIGTNGTNFADLWEFDKYANLKELFDANQFACYPNPAVEEINFVSENLDQFEIILYDQLGHMIAQHETNNKKITITRNNNIAGYYFYQVRSDDKIVYTGKFIFK